jgi:glutamine synthetase
VFGAELHATYARVRRDEWREYNTVVGEWERERYLHLW